MCSLWSPTPISPASNPYSFTSSCRPNLEKKQLNHNRASTETKYIRAAAPLWECVLRPGSGPVNLADLTLGVLERTRAVGWHGHHVVVKVTSNKALWGLTVGTSHSAVLACCGVNSPSPPWSMQAVLVRVEFRDKTGHWEWNPWEPTPLDEGSHLQRLQHPPSLLVKVLMR